MIDDDYGVLEATTLALEISNFDVLALPDAIGLEEHIENFKPDTILMDYNIGEVQNGRKICENLRTNSKTKGIKVILFTAAVITDSDFRNPLFRCFDGYLTKPYDLDDLIKIVS